MKKLLILTCSLLLATCSFADTHPEIADIIAATGWSEEELLLGLTRLDNLYQNDMKTESGRQRWHGPKVKTVVDADYGLEELTYADGETITVDHNKTAAQKVKEANSALRASALSAKGIPQALKALRAKAAQDAATTNTVTITIGGK